MTEKKGKYLDTPCACRFADDEETIVAWCGAHADARDKAIAEHAKRPAAYTSDSSPSEDGTTYGNVVYSQFAPKDTKDL